jgi:hypothetical protein
MKLFYPRVFSEDVTLDKILQGRSAARYGDGEIRLMLGGSSASQRPDPRLAQELLQILADPDPRILPCIPNLRSATPKAANWEKYATPKITNCYKLPCYGSSFITRPDSAPWIDRREYWANVRSLWDGKEVTLVKGSDRSLTRLRMREAASVRVVEGQYRDSYTIVDQLMEQIGKPTGPVVLCLGACATVLAYRLAKLDVHAIDLGHIGMMAKYACTGRWNGVTTLEVV